MPGLVLLQVAGLRKCIVDLVKSLFSYRGFLDLFRRLPGRRIFVGILVNSFGLRVSAETFSVERFRSRAFVANLIVFTNL